MLQEKLLQQQGKTQQKTPPPEKPTRFQNNQTNSNHKQTDYFHGKRDFNADKRRSHKHCWIDNNFRARRPCNVYNFAQRSHKQKSNAWIFRSRKTVKSCHKKSCARRWKKSWHGQPWQQRRLLHALTADHGSVRVRFRHNRFPGRLENHQKELRCFVGEPQLPFVFLFEAERLTLLACRGRHVVVRKRPVEIDLPKSF